MNTLTRRTFLVAAASGLALTSRASAQNNPHQEHHGATPESDSCAAAMGTPEIVPVASDIPFDLAYIDTMIPQAVLEAQPGEIEKLATFRQEWYGSSEPAELTHEMMLITMAGLESCDDTDHMNLMDGTWLVQQFSAADDKDLAFIDLVIPHHEMAVLQSTVGVQLAEHEELVAFCQDVIAVQNAEIAELRGIRADLTSAS